MVKKRKEVMKMLKNGSLLKMLLSVIVIIFIVSFFLNLRVANANQRSSSLNDLMKESLSIARKVEIDSKAFGVIINNAERSITVQGSVEGWKEMERVEQYFRLRTPSDYHVTYDITFRY
jgi:amino acid permease